MISDLDTHTHTHTQKMDCMDAHHVVVVGICSKSLYEELQDVVQLSAAPLPERPDGIVCVAKYTSAERDDCRSTEADYERLARANPATVFMRCYAEYENAHIVVSQADVTVWPTYDVFYQGRRVGRVEGNRITDVEELIDMHQFLNSKLDLFSEDADNAKRLAWGEGKIASAMKTPRTTNRFIIGYDWDKDNSFFDDTAQKFEEDFTKMFGEWTPNIEE